MLPRTAPGGVLAALALVAGGAEAADDPRPALRADVDALVQALAGTRPREGESPTARVNGLLAAGDARLRPVLEEAWYVVTTRAAGERFRGPVRRLVRFLWSFTDGDVVVPGGEAAIVEVDGVIRIRAVPRSDDPGLAARPGDDAPPKFGALVRGGRLRAAARPDLRKAFAALDEKGLGDEERLSVAEAIGEACAATRQAVQDLARRADAEPANPWLLTALAWSGAAVAEPRLRAEIARVVPGRTRGALAVLCRALDHVRREALVDQIGKMSTAARDEALVAAGLDVATLVHLASLANATEPKLKRALASAICRRIGERRADQPSTGRTLAAIAGILVSSLDAAETAEREEILAAAASFFFGRDGGGAPCPGVGDALATIAKDLASDDLAFAGTDTSILGLLDQVETGERMPLLTDVKCPDPGRVELADDVRARVRIRGVLVAQWLRLSLTNAGATPITVNPVALRHATAELSRHEVYGGPGVDRAYTRVAVRLGCAGAIAVTPADRLVTLQPTESYSWTVTLDPAHRDVEHVSVELTDGFVVRGKPAAPLLAWFLETWVK